jgi:two-component system, sensor histidine kinase and response regulator
VNEVAKVIFITRRAPIMPEVQVPVVASTGSVLIADDEAVTRALFKGLLVAAGYSVLDVDSGESALAALAPEAPLPDVVLLDVMMPGLSGFDVCRQIKANPATAHIPVLLVTALTQRSDRLKGIAAGADDFLSKPVDREELRLRLRNVIGLKRLREQVAREQALTEYAAELEARVAERTAELSKRSAELTETAARLQAANERLTELDRMKSQFVSNVSHELRTPLSNIRLMLSMLAEGGRPDKQLQYLATIERETELLTKLIEDLLYLSRLDLGRTQAVMAPLAVNSLVADLAMDRAALFTGRGLRLQTDLAPDLPLIMSDPHMLAQVMTNLMTNAMNYTPAGGQVTLLSRVQPREGVTWVTLTVADSGPGIPAEEQAHLFERFYRGAAALSSGTPGTGLGLAICHEIVNYHSGLITLESTVGQGSKFTVWLPFNHSGS